MRRLSIAIIFLFIASNSFAIADHLKEPATNTNKLLRLNCAPIYSYHIAASIPHSRKNFTEGLLINGNYIYESAGLYGASRLLKYNLTTGKLVKQYKLSSKYFAEGITIMGNKLYQLTYKANTGFIYDKDSLKPIGKFRYLSEGWGLTNNGKELIMSNGSSALLFLNPKTFKVTKHLFVTCGKTPIGYLNELLYLHGYIYANIWQTNLIAKISAKSGKVVAWINLQNITNSLQLKSSEHVLNGIAYNRIKKQFLITGKCWPKLFVIDLMNGH